MERIKAFITDGLMWLPVFLAIFLVTHCGKPMPVTSPTLSADDAEIVTINHRTVRVETHNGVRTSYVPANGRVDVRISKKGEVDVQVKNKGVGGSLGIGLAYSDVSRATLDAPVVYWNRLSLHVGLAFGKRPAVMGFCAVAYDLDQLHLWNTSVMVGKVADRHFLSTSDGWIVGVRLGF